ELAHFINDIIAGSRRTGPHCTAGGDERSSLLSDDFVIDLLVNVQTPRLLHLQQLPLAHFLHGVTDNLQQLEIIILYRQDRSASKQKIADEYCYLVFPEGVNGERTAAVVCLVNDIVMH